LSGHCYNDSMIANQMYDCVVIGGGPAGSTAAALVAEAGFSTLLVERGCFPRYHIGESLMPETYWTLARLGVLEQMKHSAYPKKYSVQFVSHTGRESQPFYFTDCDDHESAQTWQVLRSQFDQMLFENSAAKGADCRDNTRVLDVRFEGDRATGVRIQDADGQTRDIGGRVIIDASGQQSLVANKLGIRLENPDLRKAAIWGYYRGARRDEGIDEGATIILRTQSKKAWFWYIPLPENIVSVGVVADKDYLLKGRGTPAEVFAEELADCPPVMERVAAAELVEAVRVAREFSYMAEKPSGDGWVLVGDAHGFLDPIYSSGVFLALKSAEMAADCVIEGLRSGDTSARQLGRWAPEIAEGMKWIRKLIYAFYTEDFSFGQFIKQYPHHKNNLTDLLVGKVFRPGAGDIFNDMDPWLERLQNGEQVSSK